MNTKIKWFVNKDAITESDVSEYIALKDNIVICRVKREKQFSGFWVARDVKGIICFAINIARMFLNGLKINLRSDL